MEQDLSQFDAEECETSSKSTNLLKEGDLTSSDIDCCNNLNFDLIQDSDLSTIEGSSSNQRPNIKRRLKNHQSSEIPKRHSSSPEASSASSFVESNSEFPSLTGERTDLCGPVVNKGNIMEVVESLSPLPSIQVEDINDSTFVPNENNNDSGLDSQPVVEGSVFPDRLNGSQLYPSTGVVESQLLVDSQLYTNTSLDVNDVDLDASNNQDLNVLSSTNATQGYGILQNVHYDSNNPSHMLSSQGVYTNIGSMDDGEVEMSQVDQFTRPYMYEYGSSVRESDLDIPNMGYDSNMDYMLDDRIDYVMESNYNQDNTNLASHNYDSGNMFMNNLDNLTQSQDQLSNTHTVNFSNPPGNMEELISMDDLSDDLKHDLVRKNSINVLIENSDKKLDEEVMNSILRDLICPICLEYFYFPVTVACGHTFCRYCIGHSKLVGKLCPLCRQPVGRSLNMNTILSNLVKSLNLRKRSHVPLRLVPPVSKEAEKSWWEEHCLKPYVSVPLFIRIMFGDVAQAPVFFDDLCSCLIDFFDSGNRWHKSKWVFTIDDFRLMRSEIGLHLPPSSSDLEKPVDVDSTKIKDTNSVRLHLWVEDYLIANPHLCFRSDVAYPLTLKVYNDANHKIEGTMFSALEIPYKLPWDAGRHVKSLLHLPHSSVSLSHLVFAQCPNGQFGILDVGSTIGTMIKIQGVHVLQSGDRIHIGDKHEVDVHIYKDSIGTPFKDYKWDSTTNQVIDYAEFLDSKTNSSEGNADERNVYGEQAMSGSGSGMWERRSIEVDSDSNLCELDSYLKLRIFADNQVERDVWICPKGVILGRGPVTQSSYKKLSITTQNGYISREHCLIYYDGSRASGSRWLLRDMSTLGTFLKLKPFQDPLPVAPGFVFKVGQCKVEVGSPHELSRRVPSSATLILSQLLQSHMEPYRLVEIQSNMNNNQNPLNQGLQQQQRGDNHENHQNNQNQYLSGQNNNQNGPSNFCVNRPGTMGSINPNNSNFTGVGRMNDDVLEVEDNDIHNEDHDNHQNNQNQYLSGQNNNHLHLQNLGHRNYNNTNNMSDFNDNDFIDDNLNNNVDNVVVVDVEGSDQFNSPMRFETSIPYQNSDVYEDPVGGDVDPDGQVVPDLMRDDVL